MSVACELILRPQQDRGKLLVVTAEGRALELRLPPAEQWKAPLPVAVGSPP